uniref:Secreted protein n=1 Tax=Octopus bimaculoides TaxID=37653 RepID=A0A0L8G1P2_OCTBM
MFLAPEHLPHTKTILLVTLRLTLLQHLCVHSLHWVHPMEFLPTHFLQIEQGHLSEGVCVLSTFLLIRTLVLARLTLGPFDSSPCFHT